PRALFRGGRHRLRGAARSGRQSAPPFGFSPWRPLPPRPADAGRRAGLRLGLARRSAPQRPGSRRAARAGLGAPPRGRAGRLGALASAFNAMAARLAELDELKDTFLAQITHDLGHPLTAIASWVDLLRGETLGPVGEKQAGGLKVIAENAEYLNSLIGDILAL